MKYKTHAQILLTEDLRYPRIYTSLSHYKIEVHRKGVNVLNKNQSSLSLIVFYLKQIHQKENRKEKKLGNNLQITCLIFSAELHVSQLKLFGFEFFLTF